MPNVALEQQPTVIAAWAVFLAVLEEHGALSTTRLARIATDRTDERTGRHVQHVSTTLQRLAIDGFVECSRPDDRRPTRLWCLTTHGARALADARRLALVALGLTARRSRRRPHGN